MSQQINIYLLFYESIMLNYFLFFAFTQIACPTVACVLHNTNNSALIEFFIGLVYLLPKEAKVSVKSMLEHETSRVFSLLCHFSKINK